MTDHAKRRQAVHSVGDTQDIADAIDRCNLKPEYKRLLKILYVDNGCLEDVCEAVGREYTTVSKWHKVALVKLVYILLDNSPRLKSGDSRLNDHCLQEQV